MLVLMKKYQRNNGKKVERLNSMILQAPDKKAADKVRYIFGEKQI